MESDIYRDSIVRDYQEKIHPRNISRKIYLCYPTAVFRNNYDLEYKIKNKIANFLNMPYMTIQIVGSAKIGFSLIREGEFSSTESDLDVAVINSDLFIKLVNYAYTETEGYRKRSFLNGTCFQQFVNSLKNGFINPYNLPIGNVRQEWMTFFNELSKDYISIFKNINCGVYLSELLFEEKQGIAINKYCRR